MKIQYVFSFMVMMFTIAGCSTTELKSPCPDFGAYCDKAPLYGSEK